MGRRRLRFGLGALLLIVACATSPLGRKQLILVSDSQMDQMGVQAFQELKTKEVIESQPKIKAYVQCIVDPLIRAAQGQTPVTQWEVVVFRNQEANAFALPGGKIGVYTGIIQLGNSSSHRDAQLAAVIGHEIGHVIARHGAERMSQQLGTELGLETVGALTRDDPRRDLYLGLLGMGAKVGILLPFSRAQESEADLIGLNLMAKAGFDPQQSVELWKNMIRSSSKKGRGGSPEWLSTHPASENRIKELQAHMPQAISIYEKARAQGLHPECSL